MRGLTGCLSSMVVEGAEQPLCPAAVRVKRC